MLTPRWLLLICALTASLAAQQGERVIGYCDVADPRTKCKGLETALRRAARPGIKFERFDLRRAESFRPERWDAILFSSYVEMTPGWTDFVKREKADVLAFAERGGLVVFFARYRKSDTGEVADVPQVPRLEPPGWKLRRAKGKPSGIYLDPKGHPVWQGVGGRGGRDGIAMVKNRRMAGFDEFGMDAFDKWSRSLKVGAWTADKRRGSAMALHGQFGGQGGAFWFIQMILDKVDGPSSDKSVRVSNLFFANLMKIIGQRRRLTRPATPPPRVEKPEPVEPPPSPPKVELKPSALIFGRVFVDGNGDARPQAGETGVAGVRLNDQTTEYRSDSRGAFRLEFQGPSLRALLLEIPDRFELAGSASSWWTLGRPAPGGRRSERDFALRAVADPDRGLALAFQLPQPKSVEDIDSWSAALGEVLERRRPDLVFLITPRIPENLQFRFDRALRDAVGAASVDLRLVSSEGRRAVEDLRPGRLTRQPLRSSRWLAGHRMAVMAAPDAAGGGPDWSRWAELCRGSSLAVSGVPLRPEQRRTWGAKLVLEPGEGGQPAADLGSVPLFRGPDDAWVEISVRRGRPLGVDLRRLKDAVADAEPGAENGEESPAKPPTEDRAVLREHPLLAGSLEDALKAALGG
jgi:hypothetical protein